MGNQHSRSTTPTSNPQSPGVTSPASSTSHAPAHSLSLHAGAGHDSTRLHGHAPHARRRESIQALTTVKASAAPPTSTLEPASGTAARPQSHAHGRSRSQTVSTTAHVAHTLRAAHDTLKSASDDKMGNDQSRPQRPRGSDRLDRPARLDRTDRTDRTPAAAVGPAVPAPAPPPPPAPVLEPSPPTRPVDVPAAPRDDATDYTRTEQAASIEPADASTGDFVVPSSLYNRPPRLPLPIEQEVLTPGSPIIEPHEVDIASPIASDNEAPLPRRSSVLSSTTAGEDDDLGDEFKVPQGQPTVPVLIEWEGPGERVYVTGTFAGWNRKFRLIKNGPSKKKDVFSAHVHITPGTHHLTFLVDNNMRTSDKLPTAVDYTNILVNYLEVSADDVPKQETDVAPESKTAPIPVQDQPAPEGIYPPQILPVTPKLKAVSKPNPEAAPKVAPSSPKKYHQNIPRYLLDLDAHEESRHFARANAATSNLPTPPTLPMFLSKSILNGVTPMKDDSSVLILPNHTVLNHLATSSIKDNILATSATTRYKQKFLTTIMYKPKHEGEQEV